MNNTQVGNAKDLDVVMHYFTEYSDNYSKTSRSLWRYYRGEPNNTLTNSKSFKYKLKITGKTSVDGNVKNVEIVGPLNYLNSFWRTLEMPLINLRLISI